MNISNFTVVTQKIYRYLQKKKHFSKTPPLNKPRTFYKLNT